MNPEDPPRLACDGKLAFATQKEAWTAATVARFQHFGARLKSYKCKHCQLWHLASKYKDD
jgi:hypothetical protein